MIFLFSRNKAEVQSRFETKAGLVQGSGERSS